VGPAIAGIWPIRRVFEPVKYEFHIPHRGYATSRREDGRISAIVRVLSAPTDTCKRSLK
jgi:hypothetical protein